MHSSVLHKYKLTAPWWGSTMVTTNKILLHVKKSSEKRNSDTYSKLSLKAEPSEPWTKMVSNSVSFTRRAVLGQLLWTSVSCWILPLRHYLAFKWDRKRSPKIPSDPGALYQITLLPQDHDSVHGGTFKSWNQRGAYYYMVLYLVVFLDLFHSKTTELFWYMKMTSEDQMTWGFRRAAF